MLANIKLTLIYGLVFAGYDIVQYTMHCFTKCWLEPVFSVVICNFLCEIYLGSWQLPSTPLIIEKNGILSFQNLNHLTRDTIHVPVCIKLFVLSWSCYVVCYFCHVVPVTPYFNLAGRLKNLTFKMLE